MRHGQSFPNSFFSALAPRRGPSAIQNAGRYLPKLFNYEAADLFSNAVENHDNCSKLELLVRLSNTLHSNGGLPEEDRGSTIKAGYVYLAQFAVHDMVSSSVVERLTDLQPAAAQNLETTGLDLSSLYGRQENGTVQFFEHDPDSATRGKFRIGRLNQNFKPENYLPGPAEDIPRMPFHPVAGCPVGSKRFDPLLADIRNADNFILSQLTLLFMKLHNKIYDGLPNNGNRFQLARDLTTAVYLTILEEELLTALCHPDVVSYYRNISSVDQLPGDAPSESYALPVESVFAGLRFGHSMVRMSYNFNDNFSGFHNNRATLEKLLNLFGLNEDAEEHLPTDRRWIIDWSLFFPTGAGQGQGGAVSKMFNFANKIMPAMSRVLRDHDSVALNLPNGSGLQDANIGLAFRSLAKGIVFELPTGQALHRHLAAATGSNNSIVPADAIYEMLMQTAPFNINSGADKTLETGDAEFLSEHTPLFVYVLAEAAHSHGGNQLGFVGSHLVCHAFRGAVLTKLQNRPSPNVGTHVQAPLQTMADVIRFVS